MEDKVIKDLKFEMKSYIKRKSIVFIYKYKFFSDFRSALINPI